MIEDGKLSATGWLLRFVAESLSLALCFTPLRRTIYILLVIRTTRTLSLQLPEFRHFTRKYFDSDNISRALLRHQPHHLHSSAILCLLLGGRQFITPIGIGIHSNGMFTVQR